MKTKLLSLLLAMIACVALLASCGDKPDDGPDDGKTPSGETNGDYNYNWSQVEVLFEMNEHSASDELESGVRRYYAGADADAIDDIHDTTRAIDNAKKSVKELHRPYIRKSTREAVEKRAFRNDDGKFLDANTRTVIEGKYDLGHVYGHEFWREKQKAMEKGWTQKQFNDYMNNPDFYRIEDPHLNRSHKFEMPK